jgi:hypothetical protein
MQVCGYVYTQQSMWVCGYVGRLSAQHSHTPSPLCLRMRMRAVVCVCVTVCAQQTGWYEGTAQDKCRLSRQVSRLVTAHDMSSLPQRIRYEPTVAMSAHV